ncbi:MAG: helix-turn-helix domain-containing protein [Acidimicrobiales bacterium]|nr:helix-turn-helix domain-containing protein [Acidimicrobiales bacterium]
MDPQRKRTYTVTEAAQQLGISRSTAYECVRTGEIPCLRFGRRIVVAATVIDQLLSAPAPSTVPADELGSKSISEATASAASRSSDGATWE